MNGTIVVFGEALVDDFATDQVVGGAPFNVARHLAAMGAAALMITRVGVDQNGAMVRAEFARLGMDESALQIDQLEETGRVMVERSGGRHRFIVVPNQAYDYIDADAAVSAMAGVQPSMIYFGTLAQRNARSRDALASVLKASGARRFLDLNVRNGQVTESCISLSLHDADIVKVNEEELQDLFKMFTATRPVTLTMDSDEMRGACASLLRIFSLEAMIVTLGPRGSVYFGADGTGITNRDNIKPPFVIDTVGAGDAFAAVFLLGQMHQWPLTQTLARANEFAAATCALSGAVPRETAFYQPFAARWLAA